MKAATLAQRIVSFRHRTDGKAGPGHEMKRPTKCLLADMGKILLCNSEWCCPQGFLL